MQNFVVLFIFSWNGLDFSDIITVEIHILFISFTQYTYQQLLQGIDHLFGPDA